MDKVNNLRRRVAGQVPRKKFATPSTTESARIDPAVEVDIARQGLRARRQERRSSR